MLNWTCSLSLNKDIPFLSAHSLVEGCLNKTIRQVGERLREARTSQGLTLRQLAQRTGLSAAMLCHIENGEANPTVQSLAAIADALGCPPSSLFADAPGPAPPCADPCCSVLPAARRSWRELDGGIRVSALTAGAGAGVNFVEVTYPPGASSGEKPFRHAGREWGLILEGELTVDLPDGRLVLGPGDSIVLDSQLPHRFSNSGPLPMRALWANFFPPADGAAPPGEPIRARRRKRRARVARQS
jgi:transcriptional regulator with XRE-family HTH domain